MPLNKWKYEDGYYVSPEGDKLTEEQYDVLESAGMFETISTDIGTISKVGRVKDLPPPTPGDYSFMPVGEIQRREQGVEVADQLNEFMRRGMEEQLAGDMPVPERIRMEEELSLLGYPYGMEALKREPLTEFRDTSDVLKSIFPDMDAGEIGEYFFPEVEDIELAPPGERARIEAEQELASERFDEFINTLRSYGKTPETENMVNAIFPDITDAQIQAIFSSSLANIPGYDQKIAEIKSKYPAVPENAAYDPKTGTYLTPQELTKKYPFLKDMLEEERQAYIDYGVGDSPIENMWDGLILAGRDLLHKGAAWFTSVIPELFFGENPYAEQIATMAERQGMEVPDKSEFATQMYERFQKLYWSGEKKQMEWLERHPELQPTEKYAEGATKNPELFKDPGWWGYVIAKSIPFSVGVLGVTLGTFAVTKNPFAAVAAGTAFATPSQSYELYEDLVLAGAPRRQASEIAIPVGTLIASVEAATDLVVLSKMFPGLNIFRQGLKDVVVKKTVAHLMAKGVKAFTMVEVIETLEEIAQQTIHNYTVKFFDENREILEGIDETIIETLIATLPFAVFGGISTMRHVSRGDASKVPTPQKLKEGWEQDPNTGEWYVPVNIVKKFEGDVAEFKEQGLSEKEATLKAYNEAAKTEEGGKAIETFVTEEAVTPGVTEPWQMTYGEYKRKGVTIDPDAHRRIVKQALSEGKPVPLEVLRGYPDLVATPTQPVTPEVEELPTAVGVGELAIPISKEEVKVKEPRPSNMIKSLSESLNVPIRRGHIKGTAAGIYKTGKEIIRIDSGQMRTATHEAGHLLNDRYKLSRNIIPSELKPLLAEYGTPYDKIKNKKSEAFSEFIRLWVTSPGKAQKTAPNFFLEFERQLESYPDVSDTLWAARNDYTRWTRLPPSAKVRAQISLEPEKSGRDLGRTLRKIYTAAYNELHPIQHFVKVGKKGGVQVAFSKDPYILSVMTKGITGRANSFLDQGTFGRDPWKKVGNTFEVDYKGKSLKEILTPVKDKIDDFKIYLVSRRAVHLATRNIDTGIEVTDAKASMRELAEANPEFEGVAEELYLFQRHLLEYAQESGLISQEVLDKLSKASKDYVPFYRVFEGLGTGGHLGKGMANIMSPLKRIKGSERDIIDPLESIVKNVYTMMDAADRNYIGVLMADMASQDIRLGQVFEKIPTPMAKVAEVTADELGVDFIDRMTGEEVEAALNIFRPSIFNTKDNVLTVMIDGKKNFFQVEEDLYKALTGLGREDMNMLVKVLSYPAKWLRAGAVLSPDFWLAKNPARDTLTAFVYSKWGFIPIVDTIRGTWSMIAKDKDYQLWRLAGGERSMMVSVDREYLQKSFKEVLKGKEKIDYVKHPLDALQAFAEFTESGTRIGEFKRGLRAGVDPTEAGFGSRDVTLDFQIMGEKLKVMNSITAFFNANMRAMDKLVREATQNPQRFWPKVIFGIMLPSILLYLVNRDDPRWDEIPQWEKDLFWIFFLGDTIIRIPKPFELGVLFGSVPERVLEYQDSKDRTLLTEVFKSVIASANPGMLPTAFVPGIEIMTNWSFFLGRNIVPRSQQELPGELQYSAYTPELIKKFGEWINFSPRKIETLLHGYTAGLGDYLISGVDAILKGTGILSNIPKPSASLKDMPIIKALIVRDPYGSGSQSVTDFYNKYSELTKGENYLKQMLEEGDQGKYNKYLKAHPELMFFYDYENDSFYSASARFTREIGRELSEIRNKQGEIYIDPDMSPDEKRSLIDALNEQMTEVAKLAIEHLEKMPGEFTDDGNYVPAVEQTSLYDYIEALPNDIADYIWDSEKDKTGIEYGKLTTLVAGWDERDTAFIDKYYADTKDWKSGDKENYRANNPSEDAALYFWGRVSTLQSIEAYDMVESMLKQINMPMSQMEGYIPRDIFSLFMIYDKLRKPDGTADSKARTAFRATHKNLNDYGIAEGWWKESTSSSPQRTGGTDISELLK